MGLKDRKGNRNEKFYIGNSKTVIIHLRQRDEELRPYFKTEKKKKKTDLLHRLHYYKVKMWIQNSMIRTKERGRTLKR